MLETGFELSANLPELSSCLLVLQGYEQGTGEIFLPERENTDTQYTVISYHLQGATRGAQRRR